MTLDGSIGAFFWLVTEGRFGSASGATTAPSSERSHVGLQPGLVEEHMFSLKLEPELRDQFMAEAEAAHRPASQIVRELMREFIQQQQEARGHDARFGAEVEQGMREAHDPSIKRIPHEQVTLNWQQQRAEIVKRAGQRNE